MVHRKFLFLLPNLALGGAERAIVRYADTLRQAGHHAEILLLENHIEVPADSRFVSVLLKGPASHGVISRCVYALLLRRWVRRRKYDLVVSTLPFMDQIAAMARIPNLVFRIANNLGTEIEAFGDSRRAARRLARYRRIYSGRRLIAVSNGVANDLVQTLGIPKAQVRVIYNPFDFEALRCQASELPDDVPSRPFILHASRFALQKRHDVLLDAFKRLSRDIRLVLMTASTPQLDTMIRERDLQERVIVLGPRANPYPYMRAASAVVLSSDREGLPNVLVEALVLGTPAVSTNCPSGPSEVLTEDLTDFLVPVGNVHALASALTRVVRNPPNVRSVDMSRFGVRRFLMEMERLVEDMQHGQ